MTPPTIRQRILRRDAGRSLMVSLAAIRTAYAIHLGTGWVLDRLEALSRRQRRHADDLAVLGGLAPMPERLRD